MEQKGCLRGISDRDKVLYQHRQPGMTSKMATDGASKSITVMWRLSLEMELFVLLVLLTRVLQIICGDITS